MYSETITRAGFRIMRDVAVGIVQRNGEVLVCQRKRGSRYELQWEFPGGKLEAGEYPLQAMRRELTEELGISVGDAEEMHRQEWTYPASADLNGSDGSFRVFYFLVHSFAGEPRNNGVFEEIRWIPLHALTHLRMLDGNREAVARLLALDGGDAHER